MAAAERTLRLLSLWISAAEQYEDVCETFRKCHKFILSLHMFENSLRPRNPSLEPNILATLIRRQGTKEIVNEQGHHFWTNLDLHEKFAHLPGDSGQACKSTID